MQFVDKTAHSGKKVFHFTHAQSVRSLCVFAQNGNEFQKGFHPSVFLIGIDINIVAVLVFVGHPDEIEHIVNLARKGYVRSPADYTREQNHTHKYA